MTDLRAMRPLTPHKWFRLLPDDLSAGLLRGYPGSNGRMNVRW